MASLNAFDAQAAAWEAYTGTPLGRLREELTLRFLARHIDRPPPGLDVLDAGGGTGGYALSLAGEGHHVCLLDFSPAMLAVARQKADRMGADLAGRLDFCCASVHDVPDLYPPCHFDLILCHTLLEYVSHPWALLGMLSDALRPGGLLSLLLVNPHADPLRWALVRGDLERARMALDEDVSPADLFGLPRRAFAPGRVREAMTSAGLSLVGEYGVRVVADYVPENRLVEAVYWDRLAAFELAAGAREPYLRVARYHLLVGQSPVSGGVG